MDLGQVALKARKKTGKRREVNIIEFVEAKWGLGGTGFKLFPVQRIILKAHYGIPLDDNPEGFDLNEPIPKDHPDYEKWAGPKEVGEDGEFLLDDDGDPIRYYKYRVKVTDFRRQNLRYMSEAEYLKLLYDEGRCNISEVVEGHERREMILSVGRRSGKCVTGDTLVLTEEGVIPIQELGDPNGPEVQPLRTLVAQEGSVQSYSKFFYNGGVRETHRVQTHNGYAIEGTGNHRVKVLDTTGSVVWRYLDDIQVGDVICLHRGTDLWAADYVSTKEFHNDLGLKELCFPDKLTEDWGTLLGLLVGDGLWGYPTRVEMTVGDTEMWSIAKKVFQDRFGSYKVRMDKRTKNTGALVFYSSGMRKFLHDLGMSLDCEPDTKRVPWSIMKSPRSVVCSFLQGLFEADGGTESGGKVVSYCTASERLARDVQVLLLNLGIVSRIRPKMIKGREYWALAVKGLRSRRRFAECVGFLSDRKTNSLEKGLVSSREGGNTESIPHQRHLLKRLLESVPKSTPGKGWGRSRLRAVLGNTLKPSAKDDLTYRRLARALEVAQELGADEKLIEHFRHLQEIDYSFDVVTSTKLGEARVYDLHVPEGESFVANGLTNHNTFLASCIAAYETYKLISKGSPQQYYGIAPGATIQIISVATGRDQAGLLYQEVSSHYLNCPFFKPYMANNTQSYAKFQTPSDIEKYGSFADNDKAKATLKVTFAPCIAKSLRGAANMIVIFDEIAHFGQDGQSSAKEVYEAATPSTATFAPKDPNDRRRPIGEVEGRIIQISTPMGQQGQFYKMFKMGFKGGSASAGMLCIQAPTWEVNPTVPASLFEKEYLKDPNSFFTEYGGVFTSRSRGWIEKKRDVIQCIDSSLKLKHRAKARVPHFMGFDLGLAGDGSAIAIGHLEGDPQDPKIFVDYVDQIRAGEGDYVEQDRLEFDDVADWVLDISKRFYIVEGIFDQHAGIPFEQALVKRGLRQMQKKLFTPQIRTEVYDNFKHMLWDQRLVLYNDPIPENEEFAEYIQELLELQVKQVSRNVKKVEAPNMEGKHDDRSDALARMIWLASQHVMNPRYIAQGRYSRRPPIPQMNGVVTGTYGRPLRGGSSPERQYFGRRRRR